MNLVWQSLAPIRAEAVYALGLVLAIAVTVHVLLTKREVPSAVGWIALAWFAPILGSVGYALLGINRVRSRARAVRPAEARGPMAAQPNCTGDDGHLDNLKHGVGRITGLALLPGNAVQVLEDGDAGYPPMLEAIAAARRTVGLSSYIFRDDVWGGRFIDALAAAAARGVQVRVLVDGIGGGWLRSAAYHALRRRGVTATRFLHSLLPWRMPFVNLRCHKKILVVDGRVGFTGGLNIADENVMATHPRAPVQDTHFRIEGPVVRQLAETFVQDWTFATKEVLHGEGWFPAVPERGQAPARVIDSGPDEHLEKVEFAILQAIGCARSRIAIMTPYFLPDERLVTALGLAAMRGVAVDIVVPARSNRIVVDWATRANSGPLLAERVRMWRSPPPFRHSKLMVVDDEWCLVGSANWDIRSFRLNFELCVEVYDPALNAALSALMARSRGAALTAEELDARGLAVRLRDAGMRLLLPYL